MYQQLRNAIDTYTTEQESVHRTLFLAARSFWSDVHTICTLYSENAPDKQPAIALLKEAVHTLPLDSMDREQIVETIEEMDSWGAPFEDDDDY